MKCANTETTADGKPCGGRLMLAPVLRFPDGGLLSDHLCLRCEARYLLEPDAPDAGPLPLPPTPPRSA